jgi:hypothetical protein
LQAAASRELAIWTADGWIAAKSGKPWFRPDRFKANLGVRRLPFGFVTAFVTWRPKSCRWLEERQNAGRGIEPAFQFRSALGDGSWKNQGGMEGLA